MYMSKRRKAKIGQCVYCGKTGPLTKDHIPPKNLFAEPRPGNLITVPSCIECNRNLSKDDEYFQQKLVLRHDVYDHPDVQRILPTFWRGMRRANNIGFRTALLQNIRRVDVVSPGGIYLGARKGYNVELDRLNRVAVRITKGLFFHVKGFRLPDTYEVHAYSDEDLQKQSQDALTNLKDAVIRPLTSASPITIGSGVFAYRFLCTTEDPNSTAWLLLFYERVAFLCLTFPKNIKRA
jgi:hypothetical protein